MWPLSRQQQGGSGDFSRMRSPAVALTVIWREDSGGSGAPVPGEVMKQEGGVAGE